MKPLFLLIAVFALSLTGFKIFSQHVDYKMSGKIALASMLLFTASGHFLYTKGMSMMLPDGIPFRTAWIYLTAGIEIAAAAAIFIPRLHKLTGLLLILFFVLVLPANMYAATKHLDYETATWTGKGVSYLWFRVPFQLLLMAWTYFFVVK